LFGNSFSLASRIWKNTSSMFSPYSTYSFSSFTGYKSKETPSTASFTSSSRVLISLLN